MPTFFDDLCLVEPSPMARRLLWHILSVGSAWRDEPETHAARDKAGAFLFWVRQRRTSESELKVEDVR